MFVVGVNLFMIGRKTAFHQETFVVGLHFLWFWVKNLMRPQLFSGRVFMIVVLCETLRWIGSKNVCSWPHFFVVDMNILIV